MAAISHLPESTLQDLLSDLKVYPSAQEQIKLPNVFLQKCEQGLIGNSHSFISLHNDVSFSFTLKPSLHLHSNLK